ncbi:MAG: 16S rRNA (uracil(1498)-N(3))-methyltransferase [Pseudomonadota bacterium]|nr:16S rRNA (uracil(1498)-N(3))-methyltransferase [Pseudomonadales bacterium]MDY6921156.1 16S rRNA (uracil(1498)-N(3))-methyltransferase [Pseudomonadota bacterium]
MNIILIQPYEWQGDCSAGTVSLHDHRHRHIRQVIQPASGDRLRVGLLNGPLGDARVLHCDARETRLEVNLHSTPPRPLPVTLLLALPRPKVLRRTLQSITALGVKEIYLLNSFRVEKSYWQTPFLQPEAVRETLLRGLEQARDTRLPQVHLRPRFKPFVEDELPALLQGKVGWTAHPVADAQPCPSAVPEPGVLAVGPEGGFIPYEVEQLAAAGLPAITLGPRILRVETALPALLARLYH